MIKRLNLTTLLKAIKTQIESNSNLVCYDIPPVNVDSPLVYMEVVSISENDTKAMFCNDYDVILHVISDATQSSIPLYNYIEAVQNAMTCDIILPEEYTLVGQYDMGMGQNKVDESGERHAVLTYRFTICYGYKVK